MGNGIIEFKVGDVVKYDDCYIGIIFEVEKFGNRQKIRTIRIKGKFSIWQGGTGGGTILPNTHSYTKLE